MCARATFSSIGHCASRRARAASSLSPSRAIRRRSCSAGEQAQTMTTSKSCWWPVSKRSGMSAIATRVPAREIREPLADTAVDLGVDDGLELGAGDAIGEDEPAERGTIERAVGAEVCPDQSGRRRAPGRRCRERPPRARAGRRRRPRHPSAANRARQYDFPVAMPPVSAARRMVTWRRCAPSRP